MRVGGPRNLLLLVLGGKEGRGWGRGDGLREGWEHLLEKKLEVIKRGTRAARRDAGSASHEERDFWEVVLLV